VNQVCSQPGLDPLEQAQRWIDVGVGIIACSSDGAVLHAGYAEAVRRLRR
jgi:hypothetical protein